MFPTNQYYNFDWDGQEFPKLQFSNVFTRSPKKKKVRDGVHFLLADKHQSFFIIGIIVFDGSGQTCTNHLK